MRRFLRQVLVVFCGVALFFFVLWLALVGSVASFASISMEKRKPIPTKAILELSLTPNLVEKVEENDLPFALELEGSLLPSYEKLGLIDLLNVLREAKSDDKIQGISLQLPDKFSPSFAALAELRAALSDFAFSDKWITAYTSSLNEKSYYLASVAESICMPEVGNVEWNGLSVQREFFAGTLKKLDIKPEIFKVGNYKSATEPLERRNMSKESKEQLKSLLDAFYTSLLDDVSRTRQIPAFRLRNWADSLHILNGQAARQQGMITHTGYKKSYESLLRKKLEMNENEKLPYVKLKDYNAHLLKKTPNKDQSKIAVVIAEGEILPDSDSNPFSEERKIMPKEYVKVFDEIRKDKDIKAVILRINSPGGSFHVSDLLWQEIRLTREKKPIIASMSGVAASGGYYLAMACDTIMAMPNTITGSIGVFYVMFDLSQTAENLGLTFDGYKTNPYADVPSPTTPMNGYARKVVQQEIEKVYDIFLSKAAQGRHLPKAQVAQHASGRVWTGKQAQKRKLVDMLGGYEDALRVAADKAKLEKYRVIFYPKSQKGLKAFFKNLVNMGLSSATAQHAYLLKLEQVQRKVKGYQGMQARMPENMHIQ